MKYFQKNIILFLMILNIIILVTSWSSTLINLLFLTIIILFFLFPKPNTLSKNSNKLKLLGLDYYLMLFFGIGLGFAYGYPYQYILIAWGVILPIFSIYFINEKKLNLNSIIRWIKIFSLIAAFLSIIMYFFWQYIPFLTKLVNNNSDASQEGAQLFSRFYNDGGLVNRKIRTTGFFSAATVNGIFMLMGVILFIEDYLQRKNKILFILLITIFSIALYTTQTRNIYLLAISIPISYFFLFLSKKFKTNYFLYIVVIYATILFATIFMFNTNLKQDGSVYSRVYSWITIFENYFLKSPLSWNSLFGYGQIQIDSPYSPQKTYWYIDNNIFASFLVTGLIGFYLFLKWSNRLIKYLTKGYRNSSNSYIKKNYRIIILYFTLLFIGGIMNITIYNIFLVLPMLLLFKRLYYLENLKY